MRASLTALALSLVGDQQNCTHCYTNNVIYVTQRPVIAMTKVYSTVQYMATQTYTVNTHTYMIHTVTYYNITYRTDLNGTINHQIMDCTHVVCDPTRTWTHTYKTQICYLDSLLQRWLRSIDSACGIVCDCIQQFWEYNMLILIVILIKS